MFVPDDMHYTGTALGAFCIGFALPWLCNLWLSKVRNIDALDAQSRAIQKHGNHLLRLLHSAAENEHPVAITLDNKKVYIGLVAAAPNLAPHDTHLAITPFFSGYRDKDTLELTLTVDYLKVYEANTLNPDDFRVVIATENVRMASLFDHTAYPNFIVETTDPKGGPDSTTSDDVSAPL